MSISSDLVTKAVVGGNVKLLRQLAEHVKYINLFELRVAGKICPSMDFLTHMIQKGDPRTSLRDTLAF